jgi:hypothetical protein
MNKSPHLSNGTFDAVPKDPSYHSNPQDQPRIHEIGARHPGRCGDKAAASFKDPSGFVFFYEGRILRQINPSYKDNYELLMQSGLYKRLIDRGLMIPHGEADLSLGEAGAYKVIEPLCLPFISYPYEWCFSQLKDAALVTLAIQKEALACGMSLKDASSFNIQYYEGRPVFIDTLSFEKYEEGRPWVAYKQFCEHFLAPLALFACADARLGKLSQLDVDGVPLDLAVRLLPLRSLVKPSLFIHLFLHSRSQKRYSDSALQPAEKTSFSRNSLQGLIDSLESAVNSLKWQTDKTVWTEYYAEDGNCLSYEHDALSAKKNLVAAYLDKAGVKNLWDIGANAGMFSRVAAGKGIFVVSADNDPTVVEANYLQVKKDKEKNILPLLIDLVNPTPAVGWHNRERDAFISRALPDTVLALALIHHLAIGKNLPFSKIAEFFAELAENLIIEFVPKEDKQTQLLLRSRQDIFSEYDLGHFESEFGTFFNISARSAIPGSDRYLYLMTKK